MLGGYVITLRADPENIDNEVPENSNDLGPDSHPHHEPIYLNIARMVWVFFCGEHCRPPAPDTQEGSDLKLPSPNINLIDPQIV